MTDTEGTIRRATAEDLDAVLELDRAAPVGHERSDLLTSRIRMSEVIIFEHEQHVVGYAVTRAHAFFSRDFVELLAVAIDSRRNGIGSSLLQRAVDLSSTERIFTSTNQSNSPMIHLLEKSGWHYSGQLEGIDEADPEAVYYMDSSASEHKMTFVNPENFV